LARRKTVWASDMSTEESRQLEKKIEERYKNAPMAWAIIEAVTGFLEEKGENSQSVTLAEVRQNILETRFEERLRPSGSLELHQAAALRDPDFVEYIFHSALSEVDKAKFRPRKIDPRTWKIVKI
jgi:hypothetical protein